MIYKLLILINLRDDMELMVSTCPNLRKMNLVVHYKTTVVEVLTYTFDDQYSTNLSPRLATPGCGAPC